MEQVKNKLFKLKHKLKEQNHFIRISPLLFFLSKFTKDGCLYYVMNVITKKG